MNCRECNDTGIFHPPGHTEPDEVCSCVDVWAKAPERIVRDLGEPGPFGDALRAAVIERLPAGAEWDRHSHAFSIAGLGSFYPCERASIATVIAAAKALTCLEK